MLTLKIPQSIQYKLSLIRNKDNQFQNFGIY